MKKYSGLKACFIYVWLVASGVIFFTQSAQAAFRQSSLNLYGERISFSYDERLPQSIPTGDFSKNMASQLVYDWQRFGGQQLANQLLAYKNHHKLNDWLYYVMVREAVSSISPNIGKKQHTLACWYLMTQSGYKTRLLHDGQNPGLFVAFGEEVFEIPFVVIDNEYYINLTAFRDGTYKDPQSLYEIPLLKKDGGHTFSFGLEALPELGQPLLHKRVLSFPYEGRHYKIPLLLDKRMVAVMRRYPKVSLYGYSRVPLSPVAEHSLKTAFAPLLKDKTQEEQVRMLLSFTRQAFEYATDQEGYSEDELPMSPEMTLLAPYSDCEDRAILFRYLVRELVGIEAVFVEFPRHVAVGVALPQAQGYYFEVDDKPYTFCETTGPQDYLGLGEIAPVYKPEEAKVMLEKKL